MNKDIQELCRQLRPILGRKADGLWQNYISSDGFDKQEAESLILMMAEKHLKKYHDIEPMLVPPNEETAKGKYEIGEVLYADKTLFFFGIREDEMCQHIGIFGRSGSGKTNTTFLIVNQLLSHRKPFLVFDWKRSYRDMISDSGKNLLVLTPGRSLSPFFWNPLIPPDNTDTRTWLKKLIEIICHAYFLGEGVAYLFQQAFDQCYKDIGTFEGSNQYPNLRDVLNWLEEHPAKGREGLWMSSALRAIGTLCYGESGRMFCSDVQTDLISLLDKNVIMELDALTNSDKTFLIEALLLWIHHYRMQEPNRETFKHALIIEEAHHILTRKKQETTGGEAITDTIIREIRELGEAIIIIDQHPSLISIPALGNTYTTICMNLKHREDVKSASAALLLPYDKEDLLGRLPVGQAVVKLQGRYSLPFSARFPQFKITKGAMTDEEIMKRDSFYSAAEAVANVRKKEVSRVPGIAINKKPTLSADAKSLLNDVQQYPFANLTERYKRLNISARRGTASKNELLQNMLVVERAVYNGLYKSTILELTSQGHKELDLIPPNVSESAEHRKYKDEVKKRFEALGYKVGEEFFLSNQHKADLVAVRDKAKVAIEIETGKSDIRKNIEKCIASDCTKVLMVATNSEARIKIKNILSKIPHAGKVEVI